MPVKMPQATKTWRVITHGPRRKSTRRSARTPRPSRRRTGWKPRATSRADEDLSGKIAGKNILRGTMTPPDGDAAIGGRPALPGHSSGQASVAMARSGAKSLRRECTDCCSPRLRRRGGQQFNEPRFAKAAAAARACTMQSKNNLCVRRPVSSDGLRDGSSLPASPFDYAARRIGLPGIRPCHPPGRCGRIRRTLAGAKAERGFL